MRGQGRECGVRVRNEQTVLMQLIYHTVVLFGDDALVIRSSFLVYRGASRSHLSICA